MQEFCLPLTYLKLDWASGKSLTTTLSSQEHLLLINNLKFQCLRSSGLDPLKVELQCLRQSELNVLNLKLDWASSKSLTSTPSSLEHLLLINSKETFSTSCLLIAFNKVKTLFMGIKLWSSLHASTTLC